MKKMTKKQYLDFVANDSLFGNKDAAERAKRELEKGNDNIPTAAGVYIQSKKEFHPWSISPSSDDKGYCLP
jgi:hypothetical protein